MFWKLIFLRKSLRNRDSTKRSRTKLGENDGKNLVLKPLRVGSGEVGLSGKRKFGKLSGESKKGGVSKKRKMQGNADVDRISELPEPIVHHIFTLLYTKDVVRTSILSKRMQSMFYSYLTFNFDERWFRVQGAKGKHNRIKAREVQKKKFRSYIEKSLAQRLDPLPCIEKFRLYVKHADDVVFHRIENWILAALDKNVKELDVSVNAKEQHFFSDAVLLPTSLTSLKLSGCSLFYGFGVMMKLTNLKVLSMKDVLFMNGYVMKKFEENCQSIEDLRLVRCNSNTFPCLTITKLHKLRRLEVHECERLISIEVEAPNLETFWFHAKKDQECKINIKDSGKLKNLTLKDCKLTDSAFQECVSKCPLLEKLELHECISLERLTLLSWKLKSLTLIRCVKLQDVSIDAPNLYSFQYSGHTLPFSSVNMPHLYEAKFSFGPNVKTSQRIYEFQKIFGNFGRSKGFKLILYSKQNMSIFEEPREADSVAHNFSNLELTTSSRIVMEMVDNWLRERHGRSLTLVSPSSELSKLMHTMMINREQTPSCCRFYLNKCWRHYLADVKFLTMKNMHKTNYDFIWRSRNRSH